MANQALQTGLRPAAERDNVSHARDRLAGVARRGILGRCRFLPSTSIS
jgi:hypothetical protein